MEPNWVRIDSGELAMITKILLMDCDRVVYGFELKAYCSSGAEYLEKAGK